MQKKILIVEDELDIASTMELTFDMEGYEVRLSSNGVEALGVLAAEALPDLIICDIMMPQMDGYRFAQSLREMKRYDRIPLILTSAARLDESRLGKVEVEGFIRKPFDLEYLLDIVRVTLLKK